MSRQGARLYSYLPRPYPFRVIAAKRDGVWNTRGDPSAIRFLPPFYPPSGSSPSAWRSCLSRLAAYRGLVIDSGSRRRSSGTWSRRYGDDVDQRCDGSVDFISTVAVYANRRSRAGRLGLQALHPTTCAVRGEWRLGSLSPGTLFECGRAFVVADGTSLVPGARRAARSARQDPEFLRGPDGHRRRRRAERARTPAAAQAAWATNRVSLWVIFRLPLTPQGQSALTATMHNASASRRWLARDSRMDEARTAIKRIEQEARRTAEIVARVKSFYKKGAPPRPESVDVNQVVSEMLVLLRREANRHSVVMRTECAPERPVVRADRVQLQQVLMNLMLNGIEAMEEGARVLTIKTEEKDGHVLVAVSDDGVGLPLERLDRIFDSFFTTKADGTGMGLSISRSIIEAHGGRLWASNNDGGGATFYFTLPAEPHPPATGVRRHEA